QCRGIADCFCNPQAAQKRTSHGTNDCAASVKSTKYKTRAIGRDSADDDRIRKTGAKCYSFSKSANPRAMIWKGGCFRAETSARRRTAAKAVAGQRGVRIACHVERSAATKCEA